MQYYKLLLICLLPTCFANANAQNIKPKFKSITYVTYDTQGKNVIIKDIIEIDGGGKTHYRSVWFDGIADTTYQLTEQKTEQLNEVFDGSRPLKTFVERYKLDPGHHFGGSFNYITYIDNNGKKDHLTIISPFMSKHFNEVLEGLAISPSKIKYKGKAISNSVLVNQILISEKHTKYLPQIEEPPTVKQLPLGSSL